MGNIGPLQLLIIVGIALLLFGGNRIASIGKGLGEGIKNFKKGISEDETPKQLAEKNEKKGEGGGEADEEQGEKKRG
ncbi:MAG TPA: twin-arginine translocase TatA/TatE family subunit [Candidatus Nanopelagicales bacterium]|nr:twin-arginine translocase TatA/TatE family subunit [Candidatus Nanopelagicales bacterium]